jgi:hypothetical protein
MAGLIALFGVACGALSSCAGLEQMLAGAGISPPEVTFRGATVVQSPSQRDFNAFYCPRAVAESLGSLAAPLLCKTFFGAPPSAQAMQFGIDLGFTVANPNKVPLPLSEILTAITLFPTSQKSLGAVCLRLCEPNDQACNGGQDPAACRDAPGDLKSLEDFPQAVANLLVARGLSAQGGVAAGGGGFVAPTIIAASSLDVTARMFLTPEALLPVIEQLARQSMNDLRLGHEVSFNIPYSLEGTIFANAGSLGRVAAGFGPVAGAWTPPYTRLLP